MNEIKTVLAESGSRILVRVDGQIELGGTMYKTWHHEIWNDKEQYESGVEQDFATGEIYCHNLAGFNDEAALREFNSHIGVDMI